MIKETEVEIVITNRNQRDFRNKGYSCNSGDIINVKMSDLSFNSKIKITAICDNPNCKCLKLLRYNDYIKVINNNCSSLYYCKQCCAIGALNNKTIQQSHNELKRGDKYYWKFEENRLNELKNFIEEHQTIDYLQKIDLALYKGIHRYDTIDNLINKLGYDLKDITNSALIDNRGDKNRSYFELNIANWFIAQGLKNKYRREEYPFNDENYRSDFTFYLQDGKELHVEVWGYPKSDKSSMGVIYNNKRTIKEGFYEKYKNHIILVSLNFKDINCNNKKLHSNLLRIFTPYFDNLTSNITWDQIKNYNDMSEKEVLNEILKYDVVGMSFQDSFRSSPEGRRLEGYIYKNFGGLRYFVKKYNLK